MSDQPMAKRGIQNECNRLAPIRHEILDPRLKHAAVCIVIVGDIDPYIILIERSSSLRSHAGQWGLPGGRRDPGESIEAAALRELHEELGIPSQCIEILGKLDDFQTRSGYIISPVVIWCAEAPKIQLNPAEVARIFKIYLSELMQPDRFVWFEIVETSRLSVKMHVNSAFLYAPTAALLFQLRELITGKIVRVVEVEQPMFAWK